MTVMAACGGGVVVFLLHLLRHHPDVLILRHRCRGGRHPELEGCPEILRIDSESVAQKKDFNHPYLDFRRFMLQMVMEKDLYSKDDLEELLNCY
ncbi:hypothetical protein ABFX02_07G067800 [Erythranthe guttata]